MIQIKGSPNKAKATYPKIIRRRNGVATVLLAPDPPASFWPKADGYYLTRTSDICHGSLCLAGTRVLVEPIIKSFDDGSTVAEILESYPTSPRKALEYLYAKWKKHQSLKKS